MKKLILATIAVLAISVTVRAEDVSGGTLAEGASTHTVAAISADTVAQITTTTSEQTGSMVDLSAFLTKARVGMAFTSEDKTMTMAYLPVLSWLPDATMELLNLDGGVMYDKDETKIGYMLALGLRIDNAVGMAFGGEYGKKHIKKATLPTFEVPGGIMVIAREGVKPSAKCFVGVAIGF